MPVETGHPRRTHRRVRHHAGVVTLDEVRAFAQTLPRAYEAFVRGRVKFRVGQIVFVAFSKDETLMGFGFPREFRQALVDSDPERFLLPRPSDMRYRWVVVRLATIDRAEMEDLVLGAWSMCVPKRVAEEYAAAHP
jgi:hypothetical protein